MNAFSENKRIHVEFLDLTKVRETHWNVPLVSGNTARRVGERLFGITILRRIGPQNRQPHAMSN